MKEKTKNIMVTISFLLILIVVFLTNIIIKDKPGITGLWQISGRSDVTFDNRLKIDLEYNSTKSLFKDFYIIIKTVINVFQKKGAV